MVVLRAPVGTSAQPQGHHKGHRAAVLLVASALAWSHPAAAAPASSAAEPPAALPDELVIVVLPVPPHSLHEELRAAAAEVHVPGVRLVPLGEPAATLLSAASDCRSRPSCVRAVLPTDAAAALDLRAQTTAAGTWIAATLLAAGEPSDHHRAFVSRASAAPTATAMIRDLLQPRQLDYAAYQRAQSGDTEAAARLVQDFPRSPWTAAWLDASTPR